MGDHYSIALIIKSGGNTVTFASEVPSKFQHAVKLSQTRMRVTPPASPEEERRVAVECESEDVFLFALLAVLNAASRGIGVDMGGPVLARLAAHIDVIVDSRYHPNRPTTP